MGGERLAWRAASRASGLRQQPTKKTGDVMLGRVCCRRPDHDRNDAHAQQFPGASLSDRLQPLATENPHWLGKGGGVLDEHLGPFARGRNHADYRAIAKPPRAPRAAISTRPRRRRI